MAGAADSGPLSFVARAGTETLAIDIQIVAEGFNSVNGWQHVLRVPVADPFSVELTVSLVPAAQDVPVKARTITVHYAYGGVTSGSITRNLAVVTADAARDATSNTTPNTSTASPLATALFTRNLIHNQPAAPGITITEPAAVPDIELNIARADSNVVRGMFMCTMRNAHGIAVPDAAISIDLGNEPRTFARLLIDEMPRNDGGELLKALVEGSGDLLASKLPGEFWEMLRAVHRKVGSARPLTLQLNSADPYVPWELALVDPPLDPARVPLLASQVVMGRWILGDAAVASPPRTSLHVRSIALMAGMYMAAESGLRKLPKAEQEVAEIEATYKVRGTRRYDCTASDLAALLSAANNEGAQLVHFAGHGQVDPLRPGDAALFLSNGSAVNPLLFRRSVLGRNNAPLMFLNACMVGAAGEMLGDYGGFPGNCLAGNFSGLIAPLWAVNDAIARDVALEFYAQAMGAPSRAVAAIMRDVRQKFMQHPNASSYLAYVYYGNPFLTLS